MNNNQNIAMRQNTKIYSIFRNLAVKYNFSSRATLYIHKSTLKLKQTLFYNIDILISLLFLPTKIL